MKYKLWLATIPTLGNRKKIRIKEELSSLQQLFEMKEKEILELSFKISLTKKNQEAIKNAQGNGLKTDELERLLESLEKKKVKFVFYGEENYPKRLSNIPDPPYCIYYIGELPLDTQPTIAMIGARNCSEYGRYMAKEFAKALNSANIQVVSGMARGIDSISQKAIIEGGGKTFAVLGCGVDICYPNEARELYQRIAEQGGIISEYPIGTAPRAQLFPPRNRIISGLSEGVLVIEAKYRSGTLITVDMALEQGRNVYALPGRTTDPLSFGCNNLIKEGATIILSPEDLLRELQGGLIQIGEDRQLSLPLLLSPVEQLVYLYVDFNPKSLEYIYTQIQQYEKRDKELEKAELRNLSILMNVLLEMTMKGYFAMCGANSYIKIL